MSDRREFLKTAGIGLAAIAAASCGSKGAAQSEDSGADIPSGNVVSTKDVLGNEIGLLGYGNMRWPKDEDGNIIQEDVNEMVDLALEHGVNYFDSSPVYHSGNSESATAAALARHTRESYLIATKASVFSNPVTYEQGVKMYKKSLEIYNTDYIDYYLLHNLNDSASFKRRFIDNGLWDYFLHEKELGHIRQLGFSFHGKEKGFDELMALYDEGVHWDFVQIQMNYLDWQHPTSRNTKAEHLYAELRKRDIPIIIMEPLRGGTLANLPASLADRLKGMDPKRSAASWAFRFIAGKPGIVTILSGMTYIEHLEDNLKTFSEINPLTSEEEATLLEIAEALDKFPLVRCTDCKYCMPCPYGIDIPGIFKFYNNSVNEETYISSSEQKGYARARRKFLAKYDKAVESARQADHCISCSQCVKKCPQHIQIPKEMLRIDKYVENLKQGKL